MKRALAGAAVAFVLGAALAIALAPAAQPAEADDGDAVRAASFARGDFAPPRWEEGRAWRVQFGDGDPVCWLVVVRADEDGYQQGVSCPTDEAPLIAAQLAGFEVPWAGRFSPELEGIGRDQQVRFYDWPLEDGKRWQTEWFGADVTVTARFVEALETPHGIEPAYELEMTYDGGDARILRYDYVPSLGWWSRLEFNSGYVFQVVETTDAWDGPATYGVGEDRLDIVKTTTSPLPVSPSFEMTEDDDMLVATAVRSGIFVHRFALTDPDGEVVYTQTDVAFIGFDPTWTFVTSSKPGVWSIDDAGTATLDIRYLVRGVALDAWEP